MEVIGSVAAVLQLVQAVGKTVIQVTQVYHDIRDMDDALRDFDNQLGATRMMLSVLSDGIQRSTLAPSTPPWWNQDVLEALLNSCNRAYSRLGTIFSHISRQMSSATALGAYIRKRRYDSDISLLRHSIDTYTSALQLPVLIQAIQGCSTTTLPQPPTGDMAASFDELMRRIDSLQSSMNRLDHDLITRALRTPETPIPASPQSGSSQNTQAGLDATERKEKINMENDTRATLDVLKGLVGHAKDYASTIESVSISSKRTRSSSKTVRAFRDIVRVETDPEPHTNGVVNPDVGFHVHFSTKSRQDVADWAGNVDLAEGTSAASTSRTSSPPSVTTIIQSVSSITNETSVLGELHERRIQAAEKCMKEKLYDKAIPHLERLLSSSTDPEFPQDESQSARSLARALVQSQSDKSTIEGYCQKFPSISVWVDEYRLEHALGLLEKGHHDEVVAFLQSYKAILEPGSITPTQPASSKTLQRIQLTLCQALHRSSKESAKDESIPILEQLLRQDSLESAVKGDAHSLLADAYHVKGNFENAKSHGIQACQFKMDTLGRDHDETNSCIAFMADICFDNDDPDEELWRGMLTRPDYTHDGVPPKLSDIQNRLHSCVKEMQRMAAKSPKQAAKFGVRYLKENYCPIWSPAMSDQKLQTDWALVTRECLSPFFFEKSLVCWDCLRKHMERTHTLAAVEAGAACSRHAYGQARDYTGLSPFHFFAMAVPRSKRWPARQKDDCVEEMDAILKIAMMANPGAQATSHIINAAMTYGRGSKEVSALWLAATHENQEVVDFLLSLSETDATRGMGVLQQTYGYRFRRETHPIIAAFTGYRYGSLPSSRMRSKPFFRAFVALSSDEARQALKVPSSGGLPWWFGCPHMLDKFLIKCGEGKSDATREMPSSLLRFLLRAVSDRAFKDIKLILDPADIKKLFWTLWDHGAKQSNLFFMMQPIKNTIANYSYYSESYIAGRLQFWFSILNQLRGLNVVFDSKSRKALEGCCKGSIDRIYTVRRRSENIGTQGELASFRQKFDKAIEDARQSSGTSRAQDMWKREAGDADDSRMELAGSLDLFWNFLDPEPTSSPADSAIPGPQPSTETLTQVISADNLAVEQPTHSQAG
ncbi:hypothetical protein Neosp_000248 [[Neocosmospora] mangrovei]